MDKLQKTLSEGLWDNGQMMLVDIARRAGLKYGPNRAMQELMAQRNEEIKSVLDGSNDYHMNRRIAQINTEYGSKIAEAALLYPDRSSARVVIMYW
jgi:hypothetical protein